MFANLPVIAAAKLASCDSVHVLQTVALSEGLGRRCEDGCAKSCSTAQCCVSGPVSLHTGETAVFAAFLPCESREPFVMNSNEA